VRLRLEGGSGRALNSSFETPLAAAPQDEGDESERGMAGTDPRIVSGDSHDGEQDKGECDEGGCKRGRGGSRCVPSSSSSIMGFHACGAALE
jgi:hypothetical protein